MPKSIYDFTVRDIDGKERSLREFEGKTCLIVNVASRCGLTPQYQGLETLHRKYKDRGFTLLAFPANNFMAQEPGTNEEIKAFCKSRYDVTFPLFSKISVAGEDQAPLYQFLTRHPDSRIAGDVQWNFQKYLVGPDGSVLARFDPRTKPDDEALVKAIEAALPTKARGTSSKDK